MRSSPFTVVSEQFTRLVVGFPTQTLAITVSMAVVSVVFVCIRLWFRTRRLGLLNSNSSHNRHWIDYVQEFGGEDGIVAVVEWSNRDHQHSGELRPA